MNLDKTPYIALTVTTASGRDSIRLRCCSASTGVLILGDGSVTGGQRGGVVNVTGGDRFVSITGLGSPACGFVASRSSNDCWEFRSCR